MVAPQDAEGPVPARVFISYAQDDESHCEAVRAFWLFLRGNGVDARLDVPAAERPQDWPAWMDDGIANADFVVVIASPEYKKRAEGKAGPGEGRGAQFEARLIRERFYRDQKAGVEQILVVLLPGRDNAEIPSWLGPTSHTHYRIEDFSIEGLGQLYWYLTGQVHEPPAIGAVTKRPAADGAPAERPGWAPVGGVRTRVDVVVEEFEQDRLRVVTSIDGVELCRTEGALPRQLTEVWSALRMPPLVAGERLMVAGRALGVFLFDHSTRGVLAGLVDAVLPESGVDLVLHGGLEMLRVPWELLRLPTGEGVDPEPVALRPGVTMRRQLVGAPRQSPVRLAGPMKVLAAVAAPEETQTSSAPLDVEAEMQAVLDATATVAHARILEVANVVSITDAVAGGGFHILHLSAHGSGQSVELEDEDGNPVPVGTGELVEALATAGRPVPLVVLSACSSAAVAAIDGLAAGLVAHGADRVLAMQAPVEDGYATDLAMAVYARLTTNPHEPVAAALARARQSVERSRAERARQDNTPVTPMWGVATLLCACEDAPLVDPDIPEEPVTERSLPPEAGSLGALPIGYLIGRRRQQRATLAVLRHSTSALEEHGAVGGVVLQGIGGIGKTALARRVATRLAETGWEVAAHTGLWNPGAVLSQVAAAVAARDPHLASNLNDPRIDDIDRLRLVSRALAETPTLLLLDDFEQNLTDHGASFTDPRLEEVLEAAARAAARPGARGGLLVTSRYPLPGRVGTLLATVAVPPLSAAELGRMFRRLPALRDLPPEQRRILVRVIGGHPRLVEFTDALLRAGRANLVEVSDKLIDLADRVEVDLTAAVGDLSEATRQALALGSADILLEDLISLLTPIETELLRQVAVCRMPVDPIDIIRAHTTDPDTAHRPEVIAALTRLRDLTLLNPGPTVGMHPWTAELVTSDNTSTAALHTRAEQMHWQRIREDRAGFDDWIDLARHAAGQGHWDELASLAADVVQHVLPGTAARLAYTADIRDLIPTTERPWILVADLTVQALLAIGDLPGARTQHAHIHAVVRDRAAADPSNTQWQRDLSVSHEQLGDLAVAAGDLAAARTAYQAGLDIRYAAGRRRPQQHPVAARPVGQPHKLGDLAVAAGDLTAARTAHQAGLDIRTRLAAADPSNTEWQRDLSVSHDKLGDLAVAAGDLTAARTAYQAGLDIATRLAAADPSNTEWQRDLSVSHEQARRPRGRGRGPDRGPHRLPGRPRHPYAAGRRRPQQHPVAARPVGQPRQARRPRGRGRGPDRGPHRLPGRPRHRLRGWPPPTPATPSGSATCRSATNGSATSRSRLGT